MHKNYSFYLDIEEPNKSYLLVLRKIILNQNENVTETQKVWNALFCYKKKNVLLSMNK